ncbi:MAG: hypothetical protein HOP29_06320 [Phycisphaerales bacterium]|nr:hypothetical protein [Phycisphaerales bacterium]
MGIGRRKTVGGAETAMVDDKGTMTTGDRGGAMHDCTGADADACGHRDGNGRFAAGRKPGPGRPAGSADAATTDTRAIRRAIVASWDRANGPAILDKLAADNPLAYLRLVATILPREANVKADADADQNGTPTIHQIGEAVAKVCGNWRDRLKCAMLPLHDEADRTFAATLNVPKH